MEQEKKKSKLKIIIPIAIVVVIFIAIVGSIIKTISNYSIVDGNNLQDGMSISTFRTKVHSILLNKFNLYYNSKENAILYKSEPIGSYVIGKEKNDKIASIIIMITDDTKVYRDVMIATFLAVDDKLTYDDANEISKTLENDALFNGGNGVEKNGIKYEYLRTSNQDGNTFYEWLIMPIKAES